MESVFFPVLVVASVIDGDFEIPQMSTNKEGNAKTGKKRPINGTPFESSGEQKNPLEMLENGIRCGAHFEFRVTGDSIFACRHSVSNGIPSSGKNP